MASTFKRLVGAAEVNFWFSSLLLIFNFIWDQSLGFQLDSKLYKGRDCLFFIPQSI